MRFYRSLAQYGLITPTPSEGSLRLMPFSQLGLAPNILRALKTAGYQTPTPIQKETIPPALAGRDVLGTARTGTGKTAAFALPILHRLAAAHTNKTHRGPHRARALILCPTRELAAQIGDSLKTYGHESHLSHTVIFGGVSQHHQEKAVRAGVDIIVATPGRLIDLMEQRVVDLSAIEIFVLDEADRMLDMGFIHPIRRIASAIKPVGQRQTLLFSATMPKEIVSLAHSLLKDPVKISVDPVSTAAPLIEQGLYMIPRQMKQSLLEHLLGESGPHAKITRALVFTRTKHGADKVGHKLMRAGFQAETIHGNKSQNQRKRALARFSTGAARILVATDVAARGLDVDDISHVINFDMPVEPEAYVHRIGRTGRAGAKGIAWSFCDAEEREELRAIERVTGKRIPVLAVPEVLPVPAPRAPHPSHPAAFAPAHAERSRREGKSHLQRNHGAGGHPRERGHKGQGHHEPSHGGNQASHPQRGGAKPQKGSGHSHGHAKPMAKPWHPKKSGHRKGPRPTRVT
jgi:ATP-dependent RNA helicase RhlE